MDRSEQNISIEGTVVNLVYQNEENGYSVIKLRTDDGIVTVVGIFPGTAVGEHLILSGNWVTHSAYGEQFKAESAERTLPSEKKAIFDYLASGAIKGIGPVLAAMIVKEFGDETLNIIGEMPEKLSSIRGISPKMAVKIGKEFKRQAGIRRLMEFLVDCGLKPQLAVKLYKCYGDDAIDAVKENPYIITQDYFGANFFEADEIALRLGFDGDSPQRVEAAVIFELKYNLNSGHAFLPRAKLAAATGQMISVGEETIEEAIECLCENGDICFEHIAGQEACYLEELHQAEEYVANRILFLASIPPSSGGDVSRLVSSIEKFQNITYAGLQRSAVEIAGKHHVMVLTGGPGTGKTTSVCGILALFEKMGLKTALAAPTGRAAKRMSELTGYEAFTIHRLLGAGYADGSDELTFEKNENDLLDADAVVLDETSMVDILLMRSLLAAMKPTCRLVMVGDADQLPPVGPGNVFSDIIRSGVVQVVMLTEIFRQARQSCIVENAHLINKGNVPELSKNSGDFFFLQRSTKDKAVETIVELCSSRLPNNMGIDSSQIQVLSPSRKYDTGTINLNKRLQAAVNPASEDKREKEYGEFVFREGDRVMQIRNNYDIMWKKSDRTAVGVGIFNGDIGKITVIDNVRETVTVDYEDKLAVYPFEMLSEIEPAFAMTVHKSQGSEYKAVILSVSKEMPMLLTRSVLYTAVTRARELLIIVGDAEVVEQMTLDDRRQRRYSGLKTRLTENR